jgi:hypothetical protein
MATASRAGVLPHTDLAAGSFFQLAGRAWLAPVSDVVEVGSSVPSASDGELDVPAPDAGGVVADVAAELVGDVSVGPVDRTGSDVEGSVGGGRSDEPDRRDGRSEDVDG